MRYDRSVSGTAPSRPLVQSLGRALDLLEELARSDELGVGELAGRTGLQPSTVHRLLATLVERGYVAQNPATRSYFLSFKLLELAEQVQRRTSRLRAVFRPHAEEIRAAVAETTNLVVLGDLDAVYVDQVEGPRSVRMFAEIGRRVPAHTTAAGKAMLAHAAEDVLAALEAREPLARATARSVGSVAELREELERIRRRGYALDREEYEEGVACVAAPVVDRAGRAHAALSVSGPAARVSRLDTGEVGELLARHAAAMGRELGLA